MSTRLWYNKVSENWKDALALGNGRIGGMFFGTPDCERIEINEESLWTGCQLEEECKITPEKLAEIQSLLFDEQYEEAWHLAEEYYISKPNRMRSYESMGNLLIDFADKSEAKDYYKYLELSTAIAGAEYIKGNTKYASECFVSEKYDAFVYRVKTEDAKAFDCSVTFYRPTEVIIPYKKNLHVTREKDFEITLPDKNTFKMSGQLIYKEDPERGPAGKGMSFASVIKVKTDGTCIAADEKINVSGATYVEVYGTFETNYDADKYNFDETIDIKSRAIEKCEAIFADNYDAIKEVHTKDHKKCLDKFSFEVNRDKERLDLPTDELLYRARKGEVDYGFVELYMNFTRYLINAAGGKQAKLPANLEGIWVNGFMPPWGSDFHINVNFQEVYWPLENTQIETAYEPLHHFIKKLSEFGVETAKKVYNAGGWAVHHNTDVFGRTAVHDRVECGAFPMAGPWMCLHLFEHYEYTNDLDFLKEIYDILKGSCQFVLDFLVESPDGYLVTSPSNSPENEYYYYDKNGEKKTSMFTYAATIDFEIIHSLFSRTIAACKILSKDADFAKELEATLLKLPPFRVSERYGTICEWIKDYEEVEPGHRHFSPLYGLYPGDCITEETPEIFKAAKNTVDRRLQYGEKGCRIWSWTRAWASLFYARLKDGKNAWENLLDSISNNTETNLFSICPATGIDLFEMDGNGGSCAAYAEMLLQSHRGPVGERLVEILPAIPKDWESGCVKGLKARGNFDFDITWENCLPKEFVITSNTDNTIKIALTDVLNGFKTSKEYNVDGDVLSMKMAKGEKVVFNF